MVRSELVFVTKAPKALPPLGRARDMRSHPAEESSEPVVSPRGYDAPRPRFGGRKLRIALVRG